jgi:hypothetical protein
MYVYLSMCYSYRRIFVKAVQVPMFNIQNKRGSRIGNKGIKGKRSTENGDSLLYTKRVFGCTVQLEQSNSNKTSTNSLLNNCGSSSSSTSTSDSDKTSRSSSISRSNRTINTISTMTTRSSKRANGNSKSGIVQQVTCPKDHVYQHQVRTTMSLCGNNTWGAIRQEAKIPTLLLFDKGPFQVADLPLVGTRGQIAVLGVHYYQRENMYNQQMVHPDTVRCNALQQISQIPVFGVAKFRCEKSTLALVGDVRCKSTWTSSGRMSRYCTGSITTRQAKVVLLDYYWLENGYFDPQSNRNTNGYGAEWVKVLIPLAFQNGVKVVILPNDRWGAVARMIKQDHIHLAQAGGEVTKMSLLCSFLYNPLFRATQAAVHSVGWQYSVALDHTNRTNKTAWSQYLNQSHPFFLFYCKASGLKDKEAATQYLYKLYRKPLAGRTREE